jgi:NADP-dependent 3-hydroxy acid dehydrogenase YdfG
MSEEKVVLITGAGGDVARAVVPAFAAAGWRLALLARGRGACQRLLADHRAALVLDVDLGEPGPVEAAVARVLDRHGRIDAAIALAGGFAAAGAAETTAADVDRMLAINLITLVHTTRAVLPGMLARGEGFLLGVSAGAARAGVPGLAAYGAAKAAVAAYLASVRAEVEPRGVGVTVLSPAGVIDTPANRRAMPHADPARWIAAGELAASILHAAERGPRGRVAELTVVAPA